MSIELLLVLLTTIGLSISVFTAKSQRYFVLTGQGMLCAAALVNYLGPSPVALILFWLSGGLMFLALYVKYDGKLLR